MSKNVEAKLEIYLLLLIRRQFSNAFRYLSARSLVFARKLPSIIRVFTFPRNRFGSCLVSGSHIIYHALVEAAYIHVFRGLPPDIGSQSLVLVGAVVRRAEFHV